ncbi:hypothetical protein SSX86_025797 [Deinandra increscens subsp. villosa]|uniref:Avr9/Cf-9 rapidly elicited protein n=1 Tax=Deinandra increscens subsp. villosa TaxID=3103831 RepID=A0AAP0GLR1_9ASTR
MEQNLPVLPKKVWSVLRLFYFMLRKGVSKNKIWLDLNMMMKRAKIAGKALQNLLFHHHHNWAAFAVNRPSVDHLSFPPPRPGEYEYSFTPSPATNHKFSIFSYHKNKHYSNNIQPNVALDTAAFNAAVLKAMEMIQSESTSPALPGFGRSPVVRQLRVTDSPFPLSGGCDEDNHVDEAAEEFIMRFYDELRRQKICGGSTMVVYDQTQQN